MIRCELKQILKQRGLKNGWLAEQVGVTETTLSKWVNNKQIPTLEVAYKTAEVLRLEVTQIWIREEQE